MNIQPSGDRRMSEKSKPGPKSLIWLRENIPTFARAYAKVLNAKEDERANREEMKVAQ